MFIPLINEKIVNDKYLISALVEYQRLLCEADLSIDINTQSALLQFLARRKEFQYLQMMLQYQCFSYTLEIAQDLMEAYNNGCLNIFQWLIDIYHRLKRPNDLVKLLLSNGKVKEILTYVEQFRIKGVRVKDILEVVNKFSGSLKSLYVEYFLKISVR